LKIKNFNNTCSERLSPNQHIRKIGYQTETAAAIILKLIPCSDPCKNIFLYY